jgi:hypothetical protein
MDRVIQRPRELDSRTITEIRQIWPADTPDEQTIAGQHRRRQRIRCLTHKDTDRLPGRTGGGQNFQIHHAQRDVLPVDEPTDWVIRVRDRAHGDPRVGRRSKFQMPGHEVGMEVGVDHSLDPQPVAVGIRHVVTDVAAWVDNDCATGRFVTD